RTAHEALGEILALDQLHDERTGRGPSRNRWALDDSIDLRDVWVIESGQHLRLAREARQPIRVAGKQLRQNLQRNVAVERTVAGTIHLSHAASPKRGDDFIGFEAGAG